MGASSSTTPGLPRRSPDRPGHARAELCRAAGGLLFLPLLACSSDLRPTLVGEPERVVPSDGMPAGLALLAANNNLDVTRHVGRVYLAFRTAPSHFASEETRLLVVSSADERSWTLEATFARGTDLREPRLLSHDGRLFLYFAVLGKNLLDFEPEGMMLSERSAAGQWSEPEWFYAPGFIPWRARVLEDTAYLVAYVGGGNIYDETAEPLQVHWLRTEDGRDFQPAVPGQPVVLTGGGSETDFAFTDDGALIAVVRNEKGDDSGWGSKICRAEPERLGEWRCASDPRKYDSPLVFAHQGRVFLIGRRNLNELDGLYDLNRRQDPAHEQTLYYQLDYSGHPKRCALWEVDAEALTVRFLFDLPSRGDTCFPALLPLSEDEYAIYNYSSPIDGPDLTWLQGQLGDTNIYRSVLRFE